jgi:hypothetical protein
MDSAGDEALNLHTVGSAADWVAKQLKLRRATIFVNMMVERFRKSSLYSINDKIE